VRYVWFFRCQPSCNQLLPAVRSIVASEAAPVVVGSLLAANRDAQETVTSTLKAVIGQPEGEKVLWDVLATNVDAVNDSTVESVAVQIVSTLAEHSYTVALSANGGNLSAVTKASVGILSYGCCIDCQGARGSRHCRLQSTRLCLFWQKNRTASHSLRCHRPSQAASNP
jgi:hypothetical protein